MSDGPVKNAGLYDPDTATRRILAVSLGVALAAAVSTLVGWLLNIPALRGFGVTRYPDWPLSAIGHLSILLGIALPRRERSTTIAMALLPALIIGTVALIEYVMGITTGFDTFLVRNAQGLRLPTPGRPGLVPTISILLLVPAVLLAKAKGARWVDGAVLVLTSLIIGLACMSIAVIVTRADLQGEPIRVASSIPAAVSEAALALAIIAARSRALGSGDSGGYAAQWRLGRWVLPLVVAIPAVLFPIEVTIAQDRLGPAVAVEVLASVLNLLVVIFLVTWATASLKRERDALRESERRLELATEAHGVGIFEWDIQTHRVEWNILGEGRLGISNGSVRTFEDWQAFVEPDDVAVILDTLRRTALEKKDRYSFRYRFRRPDGEVRQLEGSARCFYDVRGALTKTIGVNIDVTNREKREAQLRAIVETVPLGMVMIDIAGSIQQFSPSAERIFGWRAEQVLGRNVAMLMPPEQALFHDTYLSRYLDGGTARVVGQTRELTAQRADGTPFPIELNVGETWAAGERRFIGFIRDISDKAAASARLEELRKEYAHSARLTAMGEIAAGLAHELNQPLAAGSNYLSVAEILISTDSDSSIQMIRDAREQLLRAGAIIRRLRDFLAKGDSEVEAHPVKVIIEEAVALALVGHDRAKVTVEYDLAPDATTMLADRVQIQQVLVNVLRNAAEAMADMPVERKIRIVTSVTIDDMIGFTLTDNGPGFPAFVLDRLHTPFNSTKREGGMGVGLSICRRIIEAHGGSFDVVNLHNGQGAAIRFTVPRMVRQFA